MILSSLTQALRDRIERLTMSFAAAVRSSRLLNYGLILVWDAAVSVVALCVALFLRFNGGIPDEYVRQAQIAAPLLVSLRVMTIVGARLYRWSFRMSGLPEAVRLVLPMLGVSLVFAVAFQALNDIGLPRAVYALDFFIAVTLMAALRFAPRLTEGWYSEISRRTSACAARTLIVGAGSMADLLARDLLRSSRYFVVGFVDDDASKSGMRVSGKPVLGTVADLPKLIARLRVDTVLLAIAQLPAERVRNILQTCSSSKVSFKKVPGSFANLDRQITAAMLHDLSADDLLQREAIDFDESEIRDLVEGRRVMVTGAGGSIGGEICRQLAQYGASKLIMLDMNENELYMRSRALQASHPGIELHAEVADIREPGRLHRLADEYRPEYVFHAAAHKHVPLMEDAPEEAVKNNVFGTLNVALMAHECGADRLVFISTDKAVNPSSVMGATKRVAEMIVRHLAQRSRTKMTAVRFGNVLGSAGSAIPLFKQQIERGGPVTITHPECTRYFMTISEAVGLVLIAGLGGYGELCILEMGKPIRIADLAMNLITLAGSIPGKEIPIVYTGLRKGEKLHEELLTEAEERTRCARNRINVAQSPPPPAYLPAALAELGELSEEGDREGILTAIQRLVPTYRRIASTPSARPSRRARPAHDRGPAKLHDVLDQPGSAG